ncbi:hypothetical protein MKW92_041328 [Papaver armeniacum]|nr:hypothetical protein MKW92_041328 [Papaver armeniacum]
MGGVGKSTILNKINNDFAKRNQFNLVFRVVVSQDLNIKSIQNQIGRKLGISWSEETEIYERANDIFKLLENKKFLLLLDDIWEEIGLETIGVSKNTLQITGSKVLFVTRDKKVCGFMEADRKIKIECLDEAQAWSLFQQKVKQEALSCHPDVPEVAKKVAKECGGLPLALITIGRTMSSKTDLQQWQHALHTLQESASQFSGEGFLDNVDDFAKARNEGHDVIRCLKDACLLETVFYLGVKTEYFVQMHDVVRDLAIWVTSDLGRKKGNVFNFTDTKHTKAP